MRCRTTCEVVAACACPPYCWEGYELPYVPCSSRSASGRLRCERWTGLSRLCVHLSCRRLRGRGLQWPQQPQHLLRACHTGGRPNGSPLSHHTARRQRTGRLRPAEWLSSPGSLHTALHQKGKVRPCLHNLQPACGAPLTRLLLASVAVLLLPLGLLLLAILLAPILLLVLGRCSLSQRTANRDQA